MKSPLERYERPAGRTRDIASHFSVFFVYWGKEVSLGKDPLKKMSLGKDPRRRHWEKIQEGVTKCHWEKTQEGVTKHHWEKTQKKQKVVTKCHGEDPRRNQEGVTTVLKCFTIVPPGVDFRGVAP